MRIIFSLLLTFSISSFASINEDLNSYFNNLGYGANVTMPNAFESQATGFFGGGSLYARGNVRDYQLVYLDLPSFRAGCGGIDLFTGSFSFISGQKLVDLGKSIMTNAEAYAVDVMLSSTIPEIKQVRDYLLTLEQSVNHASINSCQMAQNLVGGIWPKTAASQQKICKDQGLMGREGLFNDYVNARMECSTNKGFEKSIEYAEKNEKLNKEVVLNKNLIWSILQDKSFLSSNTELLELIMSLTGTIIFDKKGKVTEVPSLIDDGKIINALLGNEIAPIKIWRCKDLGSKSNCLSVSLQTISIAEKSSLIYKVREIIQKINNKIINDKKPDSEDLNFLSLNSLPVFKFLTVLNSSQYASSVVDIEEYATLIAHDILINYLKGLLTEVSNATSELLVNEDLLKNIENKINTARSKIYALDPKVSNKLKEKLMLVENMVRIEKQIASETGIS